VVLPSSQISPPSRIPSPHAGIVQSSLHFEGVGNVVSVAVVVSVSGISTADEPSK
jgi:hypothetical protein